MKTRLFISWLQTVIAFYIFGRFKNFGYDQIEFLEKSFKPACRRDQKLMQTMIDFNKNKLKNEKENLHSR